MDFEGASVLRLRVRAQGEKARERRDNGGCDDPANELQHLRIRGVSMANPSRWRKIYNGVFFCRVSMSTAKRTRRPVRRRPRPYGDKRARTRERLIDAAAAVIPERGLEAASIEEICARAGLSRGAFYGNFR